MAGVGSPKGVRKIGGRKKGSRNKITADIRGLARSIVEDKAGTARLLAQYQAGELHPTILSMLFHYAYGKPRELFEVTGRDGGAVLVRWGGMNGHGPTIA